MTFGLHLISYVLALETHIKLLAKGVQGLYQLLQRGESLPGGPLQIDKAEQPLVHDILDRLGVLEVAHQHSTYQWDPAVMNRLVYPWEASQPNARRTSAPENSLSIWSSDHLSNQITYNSYHDAYGLDNATLNTAFDPTVDTAFDSTLETTFDPILDPALHAGSSTNMYVGQEMKQSDWIMGSHLG